MLMAAPRLVAAPGYLSTNKELIRLAGPTCGYIEVFDFLPFLPMRLIPQGATPRKLEDRWRRTSDAGGGYKTAYDRDGNVVPYTPLNVLIGTKTVDDEDAAYPFEHDTVVTTGHLGLDELPTPTPSTRPATRFPYETKVRFADVLHNIAVLSFPQDCLA